MNKMLVDTLGIITITNDGATILKEIDVQHPAAKMMVEITKSVDNEVSDGTTSVVVLAGSLLEKAEELINKKVHPTVIVDGYRKSAEKAIELLKQNSEKIDPTNKGYLKKLQIPLCHPNLPHIFPRIVSSNCECNNIYFRKPISK
jgi:chaperonin GroEL (HSP60 family)